MFDRIDISRDPAEAGRMGGIDNEPRNPRDNDAWISDLSHAGDRQQHALADLRSTLIARLARSFADSPRVNKDFIEDMVQDALIKILENLNQFEGRSAFLTWSTAITIRLALTELRRKRSKDLSFDELTADISSPLVLTSDNSVSVESQSARDQLIECMLNVIENKLSEKQRLVLLAEIQGVPQLKLAEELGSSVNAVYKLAHDARKKLKRELERLGFDSAALQ